MALDLSRDRYGSKAKDNEKYVSGAEIMARAEASKPLKKFESDVRKFYSSVDKDTRGEGIFGAADFYEERKKQAEDLKKRAETISLYLNDNAESFTTDSYDNMMNMLSSFDTEMDDIMTRYQPSLDAKAGMRAYEDELRAAMDQKQRRKLFGRDDSSNYAIADTWTPEQRYRLGMMQMDDPAAARDYAGQVNAGKDPYVLRARAESMDLEAEKREIDRLQAELDDFYWNADYDATSTNARNAFDQEIKRREKEISDRTQFYNQAKRTQEGIQFASATQRDDFAARSGYAGTGFEVPALVEDADPDELTYEYINDPDIRTQINRQTNSLAAKGYDLLNEEEVGIYNYYYATEGPVKAQKYLDNIQETLNQRMGERAAESKKDSRWRQYFSGFNAGYSNAVTAPQYLFNNEDEYIPTSALQFESAAIREDLADTGAKLPEFLGGASIGQVGYDLANTVGNMAPSMLISAGIGAIAPALIPAAEAVNPLLGSAMGYVAPRLGQVAGAATMGLSSAGGAYQQALNAGYSKEQARNYALLSGASEAGMEYLLGGISKLGGEIPQQVIKNMVSGVDNAIARAAITLGGSMAAEGFEEGLQEVITPWLENLVLYADKDVNWDEVAYSTLLGALTAGIMEGPSTITEGVSTYNTGVQLKDAGVTPQQLVEVGNTFAADTVAHKLAGRVNEKTGAYTLGRLFNEIGATMTEQNLNDITNALVKEGMSEGMAKSNARALAAVVEGGNLTDLQVKIIESNESLAKAVRTTIIDPTATWFQRTNGYNEALMALAKEKTSSASQQAPGQEKTPADDNVDAKNKPSTETSGEVSVENETFQKNGSKSKLPRISHNQTYCVGKECIQTHTWCQC